MANYIDGFVLPIPQKNLEEYKRAAEQVAVVWKEHGALAYFEFVGDDMSLEGVRGFPDAVNANEGDAVVFGWVVFNSREERDLANERVMADPRMADLVNPLVDPERQVFDPERMVYGGFKPLIQAP